MALIIGFDSEEEITIEGFDLPLSAKIVAHFRFSRDGDLLAKLSTDDGTIEVVAPDRIRLKFPAAMTAKLPTSQMSFDCMRVDGTPQFLGFEGTAQFHKTYVKPEDV